MSVIFVVTPLLLGGGAGAALIPAAVAVAAAMGYRKLSKHSKEELEAEAGSQITEIDLTDKNSKIIEETLAEDEKIVLAKEGIEVEFYKDAAGQFAIHVRGQGIDNETLRKEGEEIIGRVRQQYAYQQIMDKMEKKGFEVSKEEVGEDKRIKIRLERMS